MALHSLRDLIITAADKELLETVEAVVGVGRVKGFLNEVVKDRDEVTIEVEMIGVLDVIALAEAAPVAAEVEVTMILAPRMATTPPPMRKKSLQRVPRLLAVSARQEGSGSTSSRRIDVTCENELSD